MFRKQSTRGISAAAGVFLALVLFHPAARDLSADSHERAFDALKEPELVAREADRKAWIQEHFLSEPSSGVAYVLGRLWEEPGDRSFAERQSQEMDLVVARNILTAMPVPLQDEIAQLCTDTPLQEARLLEALAGFRTPRAHERLVEALSDRRAAGLHRALYDGWPLRVCDIAYNTLALRLDPPDVRWPLGIGHSYDQRDRWIRTMEAWVRDRPDGEAGPSLASP